MQRCAAFQSQRSGRDLAYLEEVIGEVEWVAETAAAEVESPLILSGVWVVDHQDVSRDLLRRRSAHGLVTLLVPRWRGGNIASLVGASTSIEVRASNFDGVAWEDGQQYAVSGVSSLRSALHVGKWAVATGVGTVLLCFRSHMNAGPIVICTAAVTGKPSGVRLEEQRRLLARILDEAESLSTPRNPTSIDVRPVTPAADVATFLSEEGPTGAVLLLALLACKTGTPEDLAARARSHLGVHLEPGEVRRLHGRLPKASLPDVTAALTAFGWGAHLRRVELDLATMETR